MKESVTSHSVFLVIFPLHFDTWKYEHTVKSVIYHENADEEHESDHEGFKSTVVIMSFKKPLLRLVFFKIQHLQSDHVKVRHIHIFVFTDHIKTIDFKRN